MNWASEQQDSIENIKKVFDAQLEKLNLTESQILSQNLTKLKESLSRVDQALAHPESYGELAVRYSPDAGASIPNATSEYHHTIGVLPILLERKKLIIDRIKELSTEQKFGSLQELVAQIDDGEIKRQLADELISLQTESAVLKKESADLASRETAEKLKFERELAALKLERFERRSKVWLTFLQRESIASIVGSIVLLLLTLTLIIGSFTSAKESEILSNGFLVILGYFFGQSSTKVTEKAD